MELLERPDKLVCSLCGTDKSPLFNCDEGRVCQRCSETTSEGRDNTSRALKAKQRVDLVHIDALTGQKNVDANSAECEYLLTSGTLMHEDMSVKDADIKLGSGNEVINPKVAGLVNTLTDPTVASLEASNHRTDLLTMLGTDIAAMALDAADTIQACNSLEKMLAHQMATVHQMSMMMAHRSTLVQDPQLAVKTMNAAMKGFSTYQGGMLALRQLRGNQQQHIVVQHVNVQAGGQAMVGNVSSRGGQLP